MKMCHPLIGHLAPNHDTGGLMASLHPQNVFLHLTGCLRINLVFLVVVLLPDGEDFLFCEEGVFVHAVGMPQEEMLCSCLSDQLQSRSKDVSL